MLIVAALPTKAATLCGQRFNSRADLETSLRATPDIHSFPAADGIAVFGTTRKLWWLTQPGHVAYPAAVCLEQVERDRGYVRLPIQSACWTAPKKACEALARYLAGVKF